MPCGSGFGYGSAEVPLLLASLFVSQAGSITIPRFISLSIFS